MTGAAIRRKPSKEIVVDESITKIIVKKTFVAVPIEYEETAKVYRMRRIIGKRGRGLQVT